MRIIFHEASINEDENILDVKRLAGNNTQQFSVDEQLFIFRLEILADAMTLFIAHSNMKRRHEICLFRLEAYKATCAKSGNTCHVYEESRIVSIEALKIDIKRLGILVKEMADNSSNSLLFCKK